MQYQTIRYELAEDQAVITLSRPDLLNALNAQMRAEILHAVKEAAAAARVLVITGEGRAFCSGQDLGNARNAAQLDLERVLRDEYEPMIRAITDAGIPVIAAVNGSAAGAGANLALSCDVVIAAESAIFVQAFARIGLVPDAGGTYWLPRQIGLARAMGTSLFAEPVTARQAADWGMVWETVADKDFAETWRARARHLAGGPTQAYRAIKTALRASGSNTLEEQLALEARLQGKLGDSRDFREGLVAFLDKRAAEFEGR